MAASIQEHNPTVKAEEEIYSAGNEPPSISRAFFSHYGAGKPTGFEQFPVANMGSGGGLVSLNTYSNPNSVSNPNPSPNTASIDLSGQSSVGAGSTKVGKRKSRASSKTPIKVFSADTANFMAMVQKLTGIPSNTYQLLGSPQTSLLKPLPTRSAYPCMQGLQTLDTSAFFLGEKATTNLSSDSFSSKMPTFSRFRPSLGQQLQLDSSHNFNLAPKMGLSMAGGRLRTSSFPPLVPNSDPMSLLSRNMGSLGNSCAAASLPSLWESLEEDKIKQESSADQFSNHGMSHEDVSGSGSGSGNDSGNTSHQSMIGDPGQCTSREIPSWESLLMGNDGLPYVDSSPSPSSSGAVASHSPKAELADLNGLNRSNKQQEL